MKKEPIRFFEKHLVKREAWTVRDQNITDTFYLSIPQSVTNGFPNLSVPNPTAKGGLQSKGTKTVRNYSYSIQKGILERNLAETRKSWRRAREMTKEMREDGGDGKLSQCQVGCSLFTTLHRDAL